MYSLQFVTALTIREWEVSHLPSLRSHGDAKHRHVNMKWRCRRIDASSIRDIGDAEHLQADDSRSSDDDRIATVRPQQPRPSEGRTREDGKPTLSEGKDDFEHLHAYGNQELAMPCIATLNRRGNESQYSDAVLCCLVVNNGRWLTWPPQNAIPMHMTTRTSWSSERKHPFPKSIELAMLGTPTARFGTDMKVSNGDASATPYNRWPDSGDLWHRYEAGLRQSHPDLENGPYCVPALEKGGKD